MRRRSVRAWLAVLALAAAALASGGCAGILRSYDVAPSGLQADEDRLRRMLSAGQAPHAFERIQRNAPDDEMLHALYHGVLAYHAGNFGESARVLDIAAHIADERMTKSLSRAAFSLISNDMVLPYEPARTERLMIPYYAALARLRSGDPEGAAVEARRLSLLLQRFDDADAQLEPALRATLRYVAGAVFDAAGEHADADVAYRNAFAADPSLAALHAAGEPDDGSVLIILEQGFVAHRVEQGLAVMLLPEEVEAIAHGSAEDRAAVSAFVAGRVIDRAAFASSFDAGSYRNGTLHVAAPEHSVVPRTRKRTVCTTVTDDPATATDTTAPPARARPAGNTKRECVEKEEEIDGLPYLLKVAWPVHHAASRPQPARVLVSAGPLSRTAAEPSVGFAEAFVPVSAVVPPGGAAAAPRAAAAASGDAAAAPGRAATTTFGFAAAADLSRGVIADFERERALIVARTIARGTAKLALAKGAERRLEDRNEAAGRIIGLIGNISNVMTERADTRSWHLLPASISIARVQLPAGEHDLGVEIGAPGSARRISTGPVGVQAGRLSIVPLRTW